MLRKLAKTEVFLYIEGVYVKKACKNEGPPSHRTRLCEESAEK
jgi:hypothetical protein